MKTRGARGRPLGKRPQLSIVIALALASSAALLAMIAPLVAGETELRHGGPVAPISSENVLVATPCGVLASTYGNLTGIPFASNYTIVFSGICKTPSFVTLYDDGLNASGVFVIGTSWFATSPPNLTFTLARTGPCTVASLGPECVFQASWFGYLSNNSFSGPYLDEYPAVSLGGPGVPTGSSATPVFTWALEAAVAVAVAAGAGLTVVAARRRSAFRTAVLYDGNESDPPIERLSPADPAPKSGADALDEIF
jgi:hypothetical protein